MPKKSIQLLCLSAAICIPALGTSIPAGFISWDITTPGSTAQFDIANETGPNSSSDGTAPVSSALPFQNLDLQIKFTDGSQQNFGAADFSLNVFDGLSWESPVLQIGGTNPSPEGATLTGTFGANTIKLFDSSQLVIGSNFTATIPNAGTALSDGEFAIINATTTDVVTPEPGSLSLFTTALVLLLLSGLRFRNRRRMTCSR